MFKRANHILVWNIACIDLIQTAIDFTWLDILTDPLTQVYFRPGFIYIIGLQSVSILFQWFEVGGCMQ